MRVSAGHARLCLRNKAVVDDALVAILLVEESLTTLYQTSLLGFQSLPGDKENWRLLYGSVVGRESESCFDEDEDEVDFMFVFAFPKWSKRII